MASNFLRYKEIRSRRGRRKWIYWHGTSIQPEEIINHYFGGLDLEGGRESRVVDMVPQPDKLIATVDMYTCFNQGTLPRKSFLATQWWVFIYTC